MAYTRSRITRRRHIRIPGPSRPAAPTESPAPRPSPRAALDPREFRIETGMRPYEVAYDVSEGYMGDRSILLP
jgi:hypothetical protein